LNIAGVETVLSDVVRRAAKSDRSAGVETVLMTIFEVHMRKAVEDSRRTLVIGP
jgi:hypothetical protein